MLNELKDVIDEAERLLSLSESQRESEGVYATNSQMKFLQKQLSASMSKPSLLRGADKYISDLASSDCRILELLDKCKGK